MEQKKYRKVIDGETVVRTAAQIVIRKDGFKVYHPAEAKILADGWEPYVEPVTEAREPTARERLEDEMAECLSAMAASDAHASKCVKLGLNFRDAYPEEYEEYVKARERYNEIEKQLEAMKDIEE